eukprot:GHVU01160351.1.p1 GENE.GHVU01160351.1~~GHVU01160351.1.p1  ORF type:complete len:204 (-),score=42.46 GHVU01160351.1:1638-2249(-)
MEKDELEEVDPETVMDVYEDQLKVTVRCNPTQAGAFEGKVAQLAMPEPEGGVAYSDVTEIDVCCYGAASLLGFDTYAKTEEGEFLLVNSGANDSFDKNATARMVLIDGQMSSKWDGKLKVAAGHTLTAKAVCHPTQADVFEGTLRLSKAAEGEERDDRDVHRHYVRVAAVLRGWQPGPFEGSPEHLHEGSCFADDCVVPLCRP